MMNEVALIRPSLTLEEYLELCIKVGCDGSDHLPVPK